MRRTGLCILFVFSLIALSACSVKKADKDKIRDIEFTVVDRQDVPQELKTQIEEAGKEPYKLTYADEGYLYIARGYGQRDTSGYSVAVTECYETEGEVHMKSGLLGPPKGEEIHKKHTYPNVVIKMEYSDKDVIFD